MDTRRWIPMLALVVVACEPTGRRGGTPLDTGAVEATADTVVATPEDVLATADEAAPDADGGQAAVADGGAANDGSGALRDVAPARDEDVVPADVVPQDVPAACEVAAGVDGEGKLCPWPDTVEELVQSSGDRFYDCPRGLVCNRGVVPARCQPPQCAGAPCAFRQNCQGDLVCVPGDPPRCGPRQAAGGPCSRGEDCVEGLVCDPGIWRCRAPEREGEPCATDEPWCPGECVLPVGFWRDQGAPCGMYQIYDQPISWYECERPLACNRGVDPPRCDPPQCAGSPCGACQAGLACLPDHRCGPIAQEGDACDTDDDCAEGLRCNGSTHVCTAGRLGDPCRDTDHDCQEGLHCNRAAAPGAVYGLCWALYSGDVGDPCRDYRDCRSDLVCQLSGTNGVCAAP